MIVWTRDDVIQARRLFATGLTWAKVGELMSRTGPSCRDAVSRYFGSIDKAMSYDGPPIGRTMECERAAKDACLLYTSPSPRDLSTSRMPSSA